MSPSKWLQTNLVDVLVAVAQAQATLAGSSPTVASQPVPVEDPNA